MLPNKNDTAAVADENEFKYFIKRNASWTWNNKYVATMPPLIRPLWISTVDNESMAVYEPEPINDTEPIRNWMKLQRIANRDVDMGLEQMEVARPEDSEEDGTIVDEVEEVWVTEVVLEENWVEDGWTDEELPANGDPKVVKWSKRDALYTDCLAPKDEDNEVDHIDVDRDQEIPNVMVDYYPQEEEKLKTTTISSSPTEGSITTTSLPFPTNHTKKEFHAITDDIGTELTPTTKKNMDWPLDELEQGMNELFDSSLPFLVTERKLFHIDSTTEEAALTPGVKKTLVLQTEETELNHGQEEMTTTANYPEISGTHETSTEGVDKKMFDSTTEETALTPEIKNPEVTELNQEQDDMTTTANYPEIIPSTQEIEEKIFEGNSTTVETHLNTEIGNTMPPGGDLGTSSVPTLSSDVNPFDETTTANYPVTTDTKETFTNDIERKVFKPEETTDQAVLTHGVTKSLSFDFESTAINSPTISGSEQPSIEGIETQNTESVVDLNPPLSLSTTASMSPTTTTEITDTKSSSAISPSMTEITTPGELVKTEATDVTEISETSKISDKSTSNPLLTEEPKDLLKSSKSSQGSITEISSESHTHIDSSTTPTTMTENLPTTTTAQGNENMANEATGTNTPDVISNSSDHEPEQTSPTTTSSVKSETDEDKVKIITDTAEEQITTPTTDKEKDIHENISITTTAKSLPENKVDHSQIDPHSQTDHGPERSSSSPTNDYISTALKSDSAEPERVTPTTEAITKETPTPIPTSTAPPRPTDDPAKRVIPLETAKSPPVVVTETAHHSPEEYAQAEDPLPTAPPESAAAMLIVHEMIFIFCLTAWTYTVLRIV